MSSGLNCLNPYSNGIWIERPSGPQMRRTPLSLNPYSNGIWIEQIVEAEPSAFCTVS